MLIRVDEQRDQEAVFAINASAFETEAEANLVDALRERARPFVSLVAEVEGVVVGHIMFSPVTLLGHPDLKVIGLAPMSVMLEKQRTGIGSAMVRAGLEECAVLGFVAAVVLGHPEYYPRFGFSPSCKFDIDSEYEVVEEVFMAMELQPRAFRREIGADFVSCRIWRAIKLLTK